MKIFIKYFLYLFPQLTLIKIHFLIFKQLHFWNALTVDRLNWEAEFMKEDKDQKGHPDTWNIKSSLSSQQMGNFCGHF